MSSVCAGAGATGVAVAGTSGRENQRAISISSYRFDFPRAPVKSCSTLSSARWPESKNSPVAEALDAVARTSALRPLDIGQEGEPRVERDAGVREAQLDHPQRLGLVVADQHQERPR